jgi:DNA mismatch repair protein MutS2
MQPGVLSALEFDRIVEAVSTFALTPLGAARLAGIRPQADPRRVAVLLAGASEGARFIAANGTFVLRAPADIEATLSALAIEGRALEPLRLLGLAEFLGSVEATRDAIRHAGPAFPLLRGLADNAASFEREAADVRERIDPGGEVLDHASAELRGIRDRLRKLRARLRGTLESYLRGKDTSRYLQDQIVTDRNGRYVLVVKAEHRASIPGIIHGASASGASLYLEPLGTVELNNEIVALEEQEAEEVRRILLALTDAFRARALDIQHTVEVATELDAVHARALFSRLVGGVEPIVSTDGGLELRAARHPLLIEAVVARLPDTAVGATSLGQGPDGEGNGAEQAPGDIRRTGEPVPVDLVIPPTSNVLVITGPNTGGKTVALKTAGLLALMAQAGLHVPAAPGSRLPVFRSVFADIGDEQSIAANLSTFSWHITNVASMDRLLVLPALVLLDEVGAGTDPVEGGALGQAIVDHLRRRGATVIATTHYDALKSYASTTEGVSVAAFGFEAETFAPTYRLEYGTPGRSLALEIAARLGLSAAILDTARANISAREAQLNEHLAKMDENLRSLEHERRLVARERETLQDAEAKLRGREEVLRQREDATRRRIDREVDERVREARQEIERVVGDLKRRTAELTSRAADQLARQAPSISTGETGAVRQEALAALDAAAGRVRETGAPSAPSPAPVPAGARPSVGDRVAVGVLGLEGRLVLLQNGEAEIDVQGKRLRARAEELRLVARRPAAAPARVSVNVQVQSREGASSDLNVIGCSVDEAVARAERFLDEMLLTDQHTVRFIHGYGTGQLRRALARFLQGHPLVARFEAATPEHGGGGVTVVELKE